MKNKRKIYKNNKIINKKKIFLMIFKNLVTKMIINN